MGDKVGICISTCDRQDYLKACLESLAGVDAIVCVCDDGHTEVNSVVPSGVTILRTDKPRSGVAVNKNNGLRYLLDEGCDYIFAIEDDCIIKDHEIFNKYIKASKVTGIQHFNFGPGSPWNRKQEDPTLKGDLSRRMLAKQSSKPTPRLVVEYDKNKEVCIALYEHVVGMLSFFTREGLERVGLYDEDFYNAWEHVEHTYRFIKADLTTPFWWFADIVGSENYIEGQEGEKANTSLASNEDQFNKLVVDGLKVYQQKHNTVPSQTRSVSREEVYDTLRRIKSNKR